MNEQLNHMNDFYFKYLMGNPQEALARADEIIKNTYRTLMTRGMKGCYIYCTDKGLREYIRVRLAGRSKNPRKPYQMPTMLEGMLMAAEEQAKYGK